MFTGIIEKVGAIASIENSSTGKVVTIDNAFASSEIKIGDSIAVSGVCLTVTKLGGNSFSADISTESIEKTTFKNAKRGDLVNLERALSFGGRLGGHIVTGHIDGRARVAKITPKGDAKEFFFETEASLLRYIIDKGSVAINGVSLTVNVCNDRGFSVMLIPHTLAVTNLTSLSVGNEINLEVDIIGKYVEKLAHPKGTEGKTSEITEEYLREHGF